MRHILIRPAHAATGGDLMAYTATEVAQLYTAEEIARLAIGEPVNRRGILHVDVMAFYERRAAPGGPDKPACPTSRGTVFMRSLLRNLPVPA